MTKQKHFYLFRGLIREKRHWGDFPRKLEKNFPGSKVSMIDLPGAGEHCKKTSPLSIQGMIECMRREFVEIPKSPNEEAVLISFSLGGMISAQWLKDHPEDFQKVVLLNTSYSGISPVYHRLQPGALKHMLKVPFLKGRKKEAAILKLVTNHDAVFEQALEIGEKILMDSPVSLSNTIRQLTAAARFSIGDFVPSIPVLILASTMDRMVSVKCSRAIAKKWDCPIKEHPTAGHDLAVDDPDWIIKEISEYLN